MSEHKRHRKIKKSINKDDYLRLTSKLEVKHLMLLNFPSKSVKSQRLKLHHLRVSFMMLYHTGIRMSELQNIKISDIDEAIHSKVIYIYQSKSDSVRIVNVSTNCVQSFKEVFKEYLNDADRNGYILRRWGNPKQKLSIGYIERILNDFLRNNLGERFSTHSFRKGFINDMIRVGYSTIEIQKMIGHKHISTTSVYADDLLEEKRDSIIESIR